MPPKVTATSRKRQRALEGALIPPSEDHRNDKGKKEENNENLEAKAVSLVKGQLGKYHFVKNEVSELRKRKSEAELRSSELREEAASEELLLNIGGDIFVVPIKTLLKADEGSLFHSLLKAKDRCDVTVIKDSAGVIFLDRDPRVFHHVLNYLRGYKKFDKLDGALANLIRVDAKFYRLPRLLQLLEDKRSILQLRPGPGVNPEGDRLRVAFGVALIGEHDLVTGRHKISFQILADDYVGVGIVSNACTNTDHEFHKTPQCCVYYMSGVFYSNYPHHRKEDVSGTVVRFGAGDRIDIEVDMDKGIAEFTIKKTSKLISIGKAKRLRFAVTAKANSHIQIVQDDSNTSSENSVVVQ